jgi:hypothetical protein
MPRSVAKVLYVLGGTGIALTFLGHGILGLKSSDTFIDLVTGNYDKVLGGSMSTDAATTIVNVIGGIDVAVAVAFLALVVAAWRGSEIAYSPLAIWLFGWATAWGFLTALSRFTAVMNGAEIWDFVERGANYMLPAMLTYLVYAVRKERVATQTRPDRVEARGDRAAPTPAH